MYRGYRFEKIQKTWKNQLMKPLINRRKDFMSRLLNFNRLKDFNSGSECDIGSENVIILAIRFCKVVTGFK